MEDNFVTQERYDEVPENQKKGLGIAAVVLGGLSILCCMCVGFGIVLAIIGAIFSIVCLVKGTGSGKTLGIVGIILSGIGLLLGAYMIFSLVLTINWSNVNADTLNQIQNIDPNDDEAVTEWMQQFFNFDISNY